MTPYEFCVIRYVHSVATQEFVNIGIAFWIPTERRFLFRASERYARLSGFFNGFDGPGYRHIVRTLIRRMERVAEEVNGQGHGRLLDRDNGDNFRLLMAQLIPEDASVFQCSEILGGIADQPETRLNQLAEEYVQRFEALGPRDRHDEAEIGVRVERSLAHRGLLPRLHRDVELRSNEYSYRFRYGWMNGTQQVLEPISFDYLTRGDVIEKANNWSGKLLNLSRGRDFLLTGFVSPPSRRDLEPAFDQAIRILQAAPRVRRIVREDRFDDVLPEIENDLQHRY